MIKTTIFSLFLLLAFSSCSDDSPSESIAGDYRGTFLCVVLPETVTTSFEDVNISSVTEETFTIDLNVSSLPTLSGSINANDDIEMNAFSGSIDGVELDFSGGTGQFVVDTIVGTMEPINTLVIGLTKVSDGTDCILNLTEKI